MLVLEAKLYGRPGQYRAIDGAIRTAQFIRNKALRHWMDNWGVQKRDLNKLCRTLAQEHEVARQLDAQARQGAAERAWAAISRFYQNCRKQVPGGYPQFKKNGRSVAYKQTGWKLSACRKYLTLTDGKHIGRLKLRSGYDLHRYDPSQIKQVRLVRRADGYYAQFCVDAERRIELEPAHRELGLDVGLEHFHTDSEGDRVANPRYLQRSERKLKRLNRRVHKKPKGSNNRRKAVNRLGRQHLKVQRQRQNFAVKQARCVVTSADVVAFEALNVRGLVRNRHLAQSISDAAWSQFARWLQYFGQVFGKVVMAVPPQYTSQDCSACGARASKTLSTRTHQCPSCGTTLDRDENAAINILQQGLRQAGADATRAGQARSHALGEETATPLGESRAAQVSSPNQESASSATGG